MESAQKYIKERKFKEARIQLLSALDVKSDSGEAYYQLAEVLIRLQQPRKAIEYYNIAINNEPTHRGARLHLATILLAAKQYEMAENHVNVVLKENPKDIEALTIFGNISSLGPQKDNKKAREYFEKALALDNNSVLAISSLAHLEQKEENLAESEKLFNQAIELDKTNISLKNISS